MTPDDRRDPIAACLLGLVADGRSCTFQDVARAFHAARAAPGSAPPGGPDGWRGYLTAARQQAIHLARAGEVEIIRKGAVVDPGAFRGLVRVRKAGGVSSESLMELPGGENGED
jgi:hypothetical protein